jgi:hypothetical protein
MDTVVFGNYTVYNLFVVACAVIIILVVLSILKKIFKKEKVGKYTQLVKCTGCDWQGRVSSIAGKCPKCNTPLGYRKAGG